MAEAAGEAMSASDCGVNLTSERSRNRFPARGISTGHWTYCTEMNAPKKG